MCGIAGALWTSPAKEISLDLLRRMVEPLRHRGPDDEGYHHVPMRMESERGLQPGVALGFRRLAILDLADGNQPIANETGSMRIVLNGEIYNFQSLRHRLDGQGHVFRSRGDVETVIHLYEDEGLDFLSHISGMFALALWDGNRKRLVLARDRLGKKPLYYRIEKDRLIFASELKGLLALPDVPRVVDPAALDAYLTYQYIPHPATIFQGIYKLAPGFAAVWEHGGQDLTGAGSFVDRFRTFRYWHPSLKEESDLSRAEAAAELRKQLRSAVEQRMQSDVPLGAFLSGGVDSTTVVGLMAQMGSQPVKTFSVGFTDPAYDESAAAEQTAIRFRTEHHALQVDPSAVELLPRLAWHFDEPFADSSAIPTWCVSEFASQHVKVVLTGDGGDELFAGYDRYKAVGLAAKLDHLSPWLRGALRSISLGLIPDSARYKSRLRRWQRFVEPLLLSPERRYLEWIGIFRESHKARIYRAEFLRTLQERSAPGPEAFFVEALEKAGDRDPITQICLADLLTYLPCDLLHKVDITSMAHGLECRQPFLEYGFVEWAAKLPLSLKMQPRPKALLAEAFPELLPREVMARPKRGFAVPLDRWFRSELREYTRDLLFKPGQEHPWFDQHALASLFQEHLEQRADHSARLWCLVMLELWRREWL